ncbi:MAG TPA: DinB family protein [Herpetosiphonaceae bacterium]
MTHPLVDQLRFARSEFRRALEGLSDEDAARRFEPMNCISWNVGHLAWQEQRYFLWLAQDRILLPALNEQFANGAPACPPALSAVLADWAAITAAADLWLDTVDSATLQREATLNGALSGRIFGALLQRTLYHYWFHCGENMAIRQLLGQRDLPQFVGDIDGEAPYRPEA